MQKYNIIEVLNNQNLKVDLNNLAKSFSKSEMCPKGFKDKPKRIVLQYLHQRDNLPGRGLFWEDNKHPFHRYLKPQ